MFKRSFSLPLARQIIEQDQLSSIISSSTIEDLLSRSPGPVNTALLLTPLKKANQLTETNIDALGQHLCNAYHLKKIIDFLIHVGIWGEDQSPNLFLRLVNHPNLHNIYGLCMAFEAKSSKINQLSPTIQFTPKHLELILDEIDPMKLEIVTRLISDVTYEPLLLNAFAFNFFSALMNHQDSTRIASGIYLLWQCNLYTPVFIHRLAQHPEPFLLATALKEIQPTGLLFSEVSHVYLNLIAQEVNPIPISKELIKFHQENLLASPNTTRWLKDLNPGEVQSFLNNSSLLNSKLNFIKALEARMPTLFITHIKIVNIALSHPDLSQVHDAIHGLNRSKLLNGEFGIENLKTALSHRTPKVIGEILCLLHVSGLLKGMSAKKQRELLIKQADSDSLLTLVQIFINNLIAQPNEDVEQLLKNKREIFYFLCRHNNLQDLCRLVAPFREIGQQSVIHAIEDHPNLLTIATLPFWGRYRPLEFRADAFMHIVELYNDEERNAQGRAHSIHQYLDNLNRRNNNPTLIRRTFNLNDDSQSTHRAHVHQTSSQSARNLYSRYRASISTIQMQNELYNECSLWIKSNQLPDVERANTAKRFISAANTHHALQYRDPASNISIKTMIVLFWLVIKDDENRIAEEEDSKIALINALYEMQRGYNLEAINDPSQGVQTQDSPICQAGMFNKLLEKMTSLTNCVSMIFITPEAQAQLRLNTVIKKQIIDLIEGKEELALTLIEAIKETISQNSLNTRTWNRISAKTQEILNSEFPEIPLRLKILFDHVTNLQLLFNNPVENKVMCKLLNKRASEITPNHTASSKLSMG